MFLLQSIPSHRPTSPSPIYLPPLNPGTPHVESKLPNQCLPHPVRVIYIGTLSMLSCRSGKSAARALWCSFPTGFASKEWHVFSLALR